MLKSRKSVVGLDIGGCCVKAVEITRDRYDYIITGFGKADLPSDAARAEVIHDLFQQSGFMTKKVVAPVSGQGVFVRYLNLMQMAPEGLANAIRFEADKYIPFNVDEVQLDAQKLEDLPSSPENPTQEMRVLMVAVKRVQVQDLASLLVEIGLQPVAIGVDAFALGNAFELNESLAPGLQEGTRTVALVDVGANKACINILRNNVSSFTREIYIGGNDFTSAIMRRQGVEIYEAEQVKCDPGEQMEEVRAAVGPVLEDLGNEINLSFDYFENQFEQEVGEICLSGGSALLPFLEESFEKIFEKKTRVWNPLEGLKVKSDNVDIEALNRCAPQLAVGVGLAAAVA